MNTRIARYRRLISVALAVTIAVPGVFGDARDVRAADPLEPPGAPPASTFSDGSGAISVIPDRVSEGEMFTVSLDDGQTSDASWPDDDTTFTQAAPCAPSARSCTYIVLSGNAPLAPWETLSSQPGTAGQWSTFGVRVAGRTLASLRPIWYRPGELYALIRVENPDGDPVGNLRIEIARAATTLITLAGDSIGSVTRRSGLLGPNPSTRLVQANPHLVSGPNWDAHTRVPAGVTVTVPAIAESVIPPGSVTWDGTSTGFLLRRGSPPWMLRAVKSGFAPSEWAEVTLGGDHQLVTLRLQSLGNPSVTCTATRTGPVQRFHLVAQGTDPEGQALTYEWNPGDGSPAQGGDNITYDYALPGRYEPSVTVTDTDGKTGFGRCEANVPAPELGLSISFPDQPDGHVELGETVAVRLTASASADGLGNLSGLAFVDDPLRLSPDGHLEIVSGPTPPPPAPFTLEPGGPPVTLDFQVRVTAAGGATLISRLTGLDAAGRDVDTGDVERNVSAPSLKVTLTPSKDDFELDADSEGAPEPEEIDVKVTVENVTGVDVDNVILGPLELAAADPARTYDPFPAEVQGDNEDIDLGGIAAHQKKEVTRRLKVTADGRIKLTSLATSDSGNALGEKFLRASVQTLLEMTIDGDAARAVIAGSPVSFFGRFTNVGNDRTVAITDPMKVRHEGNLVGGGFIAGAATDGAFPPPLVSILEPGDNVEFSVTFHTERPTIADYDAGTASSAAWTMANVDFNVWIRAAVEEDDGSWAALGADEQCVCAYPESVVIEGGNLGFFDVVIDTTERISDSGQFGSAAFGLSLGALQGAQRRLSGLLDFALNTPRFFYDPEFLADHDEALRQGRLWDALSYLSEFAVWLPAAEADEVAAAVGTQLADAYQGFAETVTGGIPRPEETPTAQALTAMARTYLDQLQGAWRRGDPNQLIDAVMPVGGIVGEQVTDVLVGEAVFEALAHLATVPRYLDLAKQNWQDARTIAQMQDKLPSLAQQADLLGANELSKSNFINLENAYQARRELTIGELGGAENGAGLSRDTIQTSLQWSRDNPNQVIVVLPNEPAAAALRDAGLAVGKIENIKPKSMANIEYVVFGGRAQDKNAVLLRNLDWTDAQVNSKVDELIAAGELAEEDRAVAKQILKKRNEEWKLFTDRGIKDPNTGAVTPDPGGIGKIKAYDETGKIPNQFRGEDNGIAFSGPEQQLDFKLEYYKGDELLPPNRIGEADYVVLLQEHPTSGNLVKIVGDDDGIFIGAINGLGLPANRIADAYASIWQAFNHPFSDTWLAHIGSQLKAKLKIFSRYFTTTSEGTAGAPLVAFVNGKAFAVKLDPYLSRFDPLNNRAYLKWVGLPQAVDRINPTGWLNAVLRPVASIPWPATFLRSFLHIPGAATNPDIPPIPSGRNARVLRVNDVGHVESWTPTTGWQPNPTAEAEAEAGTVAVAPQAQVSESVEAGAVRIEITSQADMGLAGDWFQIGDIVVLDPGGPNEEEATIAAFGSLVFESPLQFAHASGELITFLAGSTADSTPPVITLSGLREYGLLEPVEVTCAFEDPESGIDVSACTVPAPAPAWTFGPGSESVSAYAIDNAGNPNLATGEFTVTATFDDLCTLTEQFSSKKNEKDLCNHLAHAEKEQAKGKAKQAAKQIDEYVKKVEKDRKAFTAAERAVLVAFARSL